MPNTVGGSMNVDGFAPAREERVDFTPAPIGALLGGR